MANCERLRDLFSTSQMRKEIIKADCTISGDVAKGFVKSRYFASFVCHVENRYLLLQVIP